MDPAADDLAATNRCGTSSRWPCSLGHPCFAEIQPADFRFGSGKSGNRAPAARRCPPNVGWRTRPAWPCVCSCSALTETSRWDWITAEASTPGMRHGEGQFDGDFVPRRVAPVHGAAEPSPDFLGPGVSDAVDDVASAVVAVFPDQAVALKPVQGGVNLPDVQRPGRAGPVLEFDPQLIAVAGLVLEQGQQAVPDGHMAPDVADDGIHAPPRRVHTAYGITVA